MNSNTSSVSRIDPSRAPGGVPQQGGRKSAVAPDRRIARLVTGDVRRRAAVVRCTSEQKEPAEMQQPAINSSQNLPPTPGNCSGRTVRPVIALRLGSNG